MSAVRRVSSALVLLSLADAAPAAVPGDLIINEIMYDPNVIADNVGEWFEILNRTASPIDINGWRILDNPAGNHLINNGGPLVVPAGGYLVIGNNANAAVNGGVVEQYAWTPAGALQLANGGDFVAIKDPGGVEIDRVTYDGGITFPDPAGASIALAAPSLDNALGANWCISTALYHPSNAGTPGAANDCVVEICGNGADDDFDALADCADPDCAGEIDCLPLALVSEPGALGYDAECTGATTDVALHGRGYKGAIVVNEIMANPTAVDDLLGEWLELVNRSSRPVDIGGFRLEDDDADLHVIAGSLVIPPGGAVVLGRNANFATNGGVVVDYQYADFTLGNDGDEVNLIDGVGLLVDRVVLDNGVTFPDISGGSMQLVDPAAENALGANWCHSEQPFGAGDRGTPRAPNACPPHVPGPGSVVVTEIMKNPDLVADDLGEWFELHNRTGSPVDVDGWTMSDDGSDVHVIHNGGPLVIPAGGFLVLGPNATMATNGGVAVAYAYPIASFQLSNDDDEIVLLDGALTEIERLAYDNAVTWPDPTGGSMALAALDLVRDRGYDWCIAATPYGMGDRGTPGAANDCATDIPESGLTLAWTTSCDGPGIDDPSNADATLTVDSAGCLTACDVTLEVTDGISTASNVAAVQVRDTQSPTLLDLPADGSIDCSGQPEAPPPVTASDACDGSVAVVLDEQVVPGPCPVIEQITRTWTATDACGNVVTTTRVVDVVDDDGPVIEEDDADLGCLWPPNHRWVGFTQDDFAPNASDACSGVVSWIFADCASSEPRNRRGDGNTDPDCEVDADGSSLRVRAERSGNDRGRRYAVRVIAFDECGNASEPTLIGYVFVPHARGCR